MWASGMRLHSATGGRGSQARAAYEAGATLLPFNPMLGFRPARFLLLSLALLAVRLPAMATAVRSGGAIGFAPMHLAQCLVESSHQGSPSGDHDESTCPFWQSAGVTVDQTPVAPGLPGLSGVARAPRPVQVVFQVAQQFGGIPSTRSPPPSLLG